MRRSHIEPLPWTVGLSSLLLYLAFPSYFLNFDGVACAVAVELGDCRYLVHGNHLAYGWLGLWFARLWRLFGYGGQALLPLQNLSALCGAAGAGLFADLLLRLKCPRPSAAAAAAALALSLAWWSWSLEAQVYMLGALFLVLTTREGLREKPRPAVLGLCHAGAILGHVGHVMLLPAALWLFRGKPRRDLARYALVLGATVAAAYLAAGLFCVRPTSWTQLKLWLLGSAALSADRSFYWHGGGWTPASLLEWIKMSLRVFAGADHWIQTAVSAAGLGACVYALASEWNSIHRRIAIFCSLWLGGYALLFIAWQPSTIVYRITDLIPLWLIASLFASRHGRRGAAALATWAAVAAGVNLGSSIRPNSDPAQNPAYQEALFLRDFVPQEGWVVTTSLGQIYIPFFAGRKPLNLRYFEGRPEALAARVDELNALGEPVYATESLLASMPEWRATLSAYGLREAGPGLYRLARRRPAVRRKGTPGAGARTR